VRGPQGPSACGGEGIEDGRGHGAGPPAGGDGSCAYYSSMNRLSRSARVLDLDGHNLTLEDARRILDGEVDHLRLTADARRAVERARACLVERLERGDTIYGVNTGFGKLASQRIGTNEVLALQENLLRSHAVGTGARLG